MSGIFGIFRFDGQPVDRELLARMSATLAHRGPDGAGIWCEGAVGMGHRMLRTTPESRHEELPLSTAGGLVTTADARIDNRDDLVDELGLSGAYEPPVTDSAVIVAAYAKWGEASAEKLLGDFALVIWDPRRHILFCARDHMGIKPFYYYRSDRLFAFASEIKALLALPEVPREIEPVRVGDYLASTLEDKEMTFYKGIFRLPPAHRLTVGALNSTQSRYWRLNPTREIRRPSDAEYAEELRSLFFETVRCRLRSSRRVGSMLSGGLDSSSIVATARAILKAKGGNKLLTFSATFDSFPSMDEREYIDAVVAEGGLEPHKIQAGNLSPLADWERVLWHQDEPFMAPNIYLPWALYDSARGQGVGVLLDGLEGDTTLYQRRARVAELVSSFQWGAAAREVSGLALTLGCSRGWVLLTHGLRPLVPEALKRSWRLVTRRDRQPWQLERIINPDFARKIGLEERVADQIKLVSWPGQTSRENHWVNLTAGVVPFTQEVADRAAAAFSIEARYPYCDKRLVEFCLALPGEQKLNCGFTRIVMRRAMEGLLADKVRWRRDKANFEPLFPTNLLRFERQFIEQLLFAEPSNLSRFVDMEALHDTFLRWQSGRAGDEVYSVWRVATLALWLRQSNLAG